MTAGWTNITVENLDAQANDNRRFSFLGADDMINLVDPSLAFGGAVVGLPQSPDASRKAGIPENVYTLTATYAFDNGLAVSGSVIDVDATESGFSQAVTLPAYTNLFGSQIVLPELPRNFQARVAYKF